MDTAISHSIASPRVEHLQKRIARLKRLAKKYKRSETIQNALLGISNIATQVTSLDDFYQRVHLHLQQLIPAENFFIASQDQKTGLTSLPFFADQQDSHPTELYPDQEISALLNSGLTGYVLRNGTPLLCDDNKFNELIASGDIKSLGSPSHQWLGVPIKNQDVVSGVLVVQSYNEANTYGELELELMGFICHHISGVMERLEHHEQLEQAIVERTKELSQAYEKVKKEITERVKAEKLQKALFEIADLSASNVLQQDFYLRLHTIMSQLIPADNCFISLINDNNMLSFPFYVSQMTTEYPASRPMQDGLTEYILEHKLPRLLSSKDIADMVANGEIYAKSPELNKTDRMHQWIGIPLIINGDVAGALTIYSLGDAHIYQLKDLELLTFVSQHMANAIERKLAAESLKNSHEQLEDKVVKRTRALAELNSNLQQEINQRRKIEDQLLHDAQHDGLTGLPNRSYLMERLSQALKHLRRHGLDQFALLFIDLDRFKVINDSFGHLEGDRFLIETAQRIKSCVRENDTLARMGGDEFVILLDSINATEDAIEVSDRILQALSMPYQLAKQEFISGASIGIAFSGRNKLVTSESLLRDADAAMYQAKANGKGCYVIFDDKLSAQSKLQHELEIDFKNALDQQEFEINYVEVVDFTNGEIIAIEPHVEWHHPKQGIIEHGKMKSLAAQYQLTLNIDGYIFSHLSEQYQFLKQKYGPSVYLHLSISSQHIKNKFVLRNLKQTIKSSNINLEKLILFFNEKALVQDTENHINGFELISQLGVQIGIDGYGTGYSSLSCLSFLPIKALKLDDDISKHLLNDKQLQLVKAYQLTAQTLNFDMYATTVDTQQQVRQFLELGYVRGQGRAISKLFNEKKKPHKACA
ncbi:MULTISPECIES: diguanylate cyclase [unclassified Shewanella]|jgi:diguanylate cyclase (GGDEF)-like protein|uniref:sensor domain-containing phosphodiesterase n=1 Tax=unclassified Shewanella TaxID=196818 RepID=UPI00137B95B0|nr:MULTISPECIES: diguanylate cyclase [unclassified Shewanella]MBB1363007.1 diguanylate cyclase [Shewanella sp. SR44-4]MBO1896485.1 diguanylate cyclase [Shewanella sp. BF02_Schw]QHS12025.1 diguanylate cyclase [Shewanella sp. Arc9-LZ]